MSWERAEPHKCPDGLPCYGHKITVQYIKVEHGGEMVMSRETSCKRCGNSCGSDSIAPHKEWRV